MQCVDKTIFLDACPTWHARATSATFLRFRDTWGALVTRRLDSAEIVIRVEWRVADGVSSSTIATMIMPGSMIMPDYYFFARGTIDLAGPIVIK